MRGFFLAQGLLRNVSMTALQKLLTGIEAGFMIRPVIGTVLAN
jgi:hypothetical protein